MTTIIWRDLISHTSWITCTDCARIYPYTLRLRLFVMLAPFYADRDGQPIGAQERHDYQPLNIDFTFIDFQKTKKQNSDILQEFARLVGPESK